MNAQNSLLTVQLETPTCLAERREVLTRGRSFQQEQHCPARALNARHAHVTDGIQIDRVEQSSNHRPLTKSCVRNKRKTTLTDQTTAMMVCGCSDRADSIRMQRQVGRMSASASSIMRMHVWASFVFSTGYFATLTIELVADA